jgi:hypothetical protein
MIVTGSDAAQFEIAVTSLIVERWIGPSFKL